MNKRALMLALLLLFVAGQSKGIELRQSAFDQGIQEARYSLATGDQTAIQLLADPAEGSGAPAAKAVSHKSPGKAFILSALVPGLGQYYYGSRVKPWLFFGADVASWGLYFKWHSQGNDLSDRFENFQRTYWSRERYATYLYAAYGDSSDANLHEQEVSHHLPDTETGQYFEMTGKYDQFVWGWDDARLNGDSLDELLGLGAGLRVTNPTNTPKSNHRDTYEDMRYQANKKFDHATAMVIVAMANRLISGFEAFFSTRARNKNAGLDSDQDFSQLHFETSLRSFNTLRDTPFITAYYKF